MTAALPPAAGALFIVISGSAMSDGFKDLLYSVTTSACGLLLFSLLCWTNSLHDRADLISWAGLGTIVAGAFVIGSAALAVNDHKLAVYGDTEQVTVTSVIREPHEGGTEDNPVDYFTYAYEVTDMRGAKVNGEIHTGQVKQQFRAGQRILATVDPRGRLDPVLGRPPATSAGYWVALAAELAVFGLVITNALPDAEERSQQAWDAAYREFRDSHRYR